MGGVRARERLLPRAGARARRGARLGAPRRARDGRPDRPARSRPRRAAARRAGQARPHSGRPRAPAGSGARRAHRGGVARGRLQRAGGRRAARRRGRRRCGRRGAGHLLPGVGEGEGMSATAGSAADRRLLKMSKLAERSGVSAGTIRYYLREGLLGEGEDIVRTSRNMAYYPPEYVERIELIKRLQEKRYMPLRVIKGTLEEDPGRVHALIELEDRILERALASAEDSRRVSL